MMKISTEARQNIQNFIYGLSRAIYDILYPIVPSLKVDVILVSNGVGICVGIGESITQHENLSSLTYSVNYHWSTDRIIDGIVTHGTRSNQHLKIDLDKIHREINARMQQDDILPMINSFAQKIK